MRVSAAIIVRDESAFIEACLASLDGFVDEIVLVDTGSVDDTLNKARRFPIKLHRYQWRRNFSAARNFAIEQSSGDWILYIDADERLEVSDRGVWRDVVADSRNAGCKLRFYPRVGWTPYMELRLFRNDPRIRFHGVIHERMHDGIEAVCREDGMEIGSCDVAIRHVGYEGGVRHKVSRNVPLLRDYLANDPSRVYCWWHLGQMLLLDGDERSAAEAWHGGIRAARAAGTKGPTTNGMPYFSLLLLMHSHGESIDDLLAEALHLYPTHLALRWLACRDAIERGDTEIVRKDLEELAAIDPDRFVDPELSYDKKLFSYAAPESLALCLFRARNFREAAEWYRRAAPASSEPGACVMRARLAEAMAISRSSEPAPS